VEAISSFLSPSELLTAVDQERGRREPVAVERTALPWRALAQSIAWWSCAEEVIVMIAGERFYAAASIASPRHDSGLSARVPLRTGRPTMLGVLGGA
jgi:hypothetical protein